MNIELAKTSNHALLKKKACFFSSSGAFSFSENSFLICHFRSVRSYPSKLPLAFTLKKLNKEKIQFKICFTVILGRDYRYTWQNFIYKKGGREILMRLFMRNKESLMRKDEIGQALCFAPFALSYGASIHPKKSLIKKKIQ